MKKKQRTVYYAVSGRLPEQSIVVDPSIFGKIENVFVLRADGEGMKGAEIHTGDYLLFAPDETPRDGDIVVGTFDGQTVCRRIFFKEDALLVRREDGETPDFQTSDYTILAVLVGTMRSIQRTKSHQKQVSKASRQNV